jgi:hypothetical protein
VSTYFGTQDSFAWDRSGEFVVVQGYGWLPKGTKSLAEPLWHAYLAIVTSDLFGILLSAVSNHVGGGQWNLSKRFVETLPIPDLRRQAVSPDLVGALARIGRAVATDGSAKLSKETRDDWRDLVRTAYGLVQLHS